MKYLKIKNKGELDIRLVSLMGGTTKTGNSYKIGRFGTGLKYSLAYLVRNNIDFKIFIGEKEVKITTVKEEIQGTTFEIIYIDGQRSSITSTMGADWEGWMIVREIYCNALDEGEYEKEITQDLLGTAGCTTFYLQLVDEIKSTVDNWDSYFLHDVKPLYSCEKFAVYPPFDHLRLYKNGVLIHQEKEGDKPIFSYDIKDASINELREYKGYQFMDLNECIKNLDLKTTEIFLNNLKEDTYEYKLDFGYWGEFNENWKTVIGNAKIIAKDDLKSMRDRGVDIDEAAVLPLPQSLFDKLSHRFPGISAVRRADKVSAFYETFDAELELKIKSALAILETCGYDMNPELKFIYGVFGNPATFASVNMDTKIVMFSTELKHKPMFEIVACVIEENEHFVTGFGDLTRAFQTHFIHRYTKKLFEINNVPV